MQQQDYPFIWFGETRTSIDLTNNPWSETIENSLDEEDSSDMNLSFQARNELIESRKVDLAEDEIMFK